MKLNWPLIWWLLLATSLAGCATGDVLRPGNAGVVTQTLQLPVPDQSAMDSAYGLGGEYRVGAQDLLKVSVFGLPDMDRMVRVNSGGQISLPLAGTIRAGGMTISELEKTIALRLSDAYLQDPRVSVFVEEFASQRVTVDGAVTKPGVYPLTGDTTLLQTIALAEGLDPLANPHGVVVFRMIEGRKMAAVFDIEAIRRGQMEDPRVFRGDIITVDQSGPKTALRRFIESVPALAIFGLF